MSESLALKFGQLRSEYRSDYLTNYFRHVPSTAMPLIEQSEESLVFLDPDGDLSRVYFGTGNLDDLKLVLRKLPKLPLALDHIGESLPDSVKRSLVEGGFVLEATFRRISNYHFREFQSHVSPNRAEPADRSEVLQRIHEDFDLYVDHLPSANELAEFIERRWVLVNRHPETNRITGYLVYEEQGARTLIRSWHSSSQDIPMGGMVLLGQFHSAGASAGVKSTFGWVNEHNRMAIMVYRRFGYEFDGLRDFIFARGK